MADLRRILEVKTISILGSRPGFFWHRGGVFHLQPAGPGGLKNREDIAGEVTKMLCHLFVLRLFSLNIFYCMYPIRQNYWNLKTNYAIKNLSLFRMFQTCAKHSGCVISYRWGLVAP